MRWEANPNCRVRPLSTAEILNRAAVRDGRRGKEFRLGRNRSDAPNTYRPHHPRRA
jgi:hypothetical protein